MPVGSAGHPSPSKLKSDAALRNPKKPKYKAALATSLCPCRPEIEADQRSPDLVIRQAKLSRERMGIDGRACGDGSANAAVCVC